MKLLTTIERNPALGRQSSMRIWRWLVFLGCVLAMTARPARADVDTAPLLLVIVEVGAGAGCDAGDVRRAIRSELGATIASPSEPRASEATRALLVGVERGHVAMLLHRTPRCRWPGQFRSRRNAARGCAPSPGWPGTWCAIKSPRIVDAVDAAAPAPPPRRRPSRSCPRTSRRSSRRRCAKRSAVSDDARVGAPRGSRSRDVRATAALRVDGDGRWRTYARSRASTLYPSNDYFASVKTRLLVAATTWLA